MAIYARLVRPEARLHLWLGKPLRTPDGVVFAFGGDRDPLFGPALWKFLADRETEAVTIAVDGELEDTYDFPLVGGEDPGDVPFADYLRADPPGPADHYLLGRVLLRRRAGGDEAFTRRLRWEPTERLRRHELGYDDAELLAVPEAEAVRATLATLAVVSGLRIRPGR